jgi:hypothetical protein
MRIGTYLVAAIMAGLLTGCATRPVERSDTVPTPAQIEAAVARFAGASALQLKGPEAEMDSIAMTATELGWRVQPVKEPQVKGGDGWTVYAPLMNDKTIRLLPPTVRTPDDVRVLFTAIAPKIGLATDLEPVFP